MLKELPASTRFRCSHGVLKPQFAWSLELGKPVPLTGEMLNPLCSICSGPLSVRKSKAAESSAAELLEAINV